MKEDLEKLRFATNKEYGYMCSNCECMHFYIKRTSDGSYLECANCGNIPIDYEAVPTKHEENVKVNYEGKEHKILN